MHLCWQLKSQAEAVYKLKLMTLGPDSVHELL